MQALGAGLVNPREALLQADDQLGRGHGLVDQLADVVVDVGALTCLSMNSCVAPGAASYPS